MIEAHELFAQVAAEPTLDELMRRASPQLTRDERLMLVGRFRAKRAAYAAKVQEREDRKAEEENE